MLNDYNEPSPHTKMFIIFRLVHHMPGDIRGPRSQFEFTRLAFLYLQTPRVYSITDL